MALARDVARGEGLLADSSAVDLPREDYDDDGGGLEMILVDVQGTE